MHDRTHIISVASRSRRPDWWRSLQITRNSWFTSRATSCWMDSAVFFLWRDSIGQGACPADLLIDLQQFLTESPETMKSLHLALRLPQFYSGGKGLAGG